MINFNHWKRSHHLLDSTPEVLTLDGLNEGELIERYLNARDWTLQPSEGAEGALTEPPPYIKIWLRLILENEGLEGLRVRVRHLAFHDLKLDRELELNGLKLRLELSPPLSNMDVWQLHCIGEPELISGLEVSFSRCELIDHHPEGMLSPVLYDSRYEIMGLAFRPRPNFERGGALSIRYEGLSQTISWGPLRDDGLFEMSALCGGRALARLAVEELERYEPWLEHSDG